MGKPCLFPDCEENASWVLKYDICYRFWWIPFIRLKKILFSFWFSKVFYHEKVRDLIKIFFCIGRSYSFSPLISSCGDIELSFKVLLVMIHYLYVNILTYTYIFTWKCEYMMNNQHMIWFGDLGFLHELSGPAQASVTILFPLTAFPGELGIQFCCQFYFLAGALLKWTLLVHTLNM